MDVDVGHTKIVMGLETEYGIFANGSSGANLVEMFRSTERWRKAFAKIPVPLINAPDAFLANGARLYVDCGHPEYATPECGDPWSLVAAAKAGDRIVDKWIRKIGKKARISLASSAIGPSMRNRITSWGSHESYSTRLNPYSEEMQATIMPHLASRPAICGPGGFVRSRDEYGNDFLKFCLSPRLTTFVQEMGGDTTGKRGLINMKNEPHSDNRFHRLHLICGDSVCSETSLFLRFATTALLVTLADNGRVPKIKMRRPVMAAMKRWLYEPGRGKGSAFDVQRQLHDFVSGHLTYDFMPMWAGRAADIWLDCINLAENDEAGAATRLDWALKKALYQKMTKRPVAEVAEFDAKFPVIGDGVFFQVEEHLKHKIVTEDAIKRAISIPPSGTRAMTRGAEIRRIAAEEPKANAYRASWDTIINDRGYSLDMPNPI